MAKSKQGKTSVSVRRKRGQGVSDGLVSDSGSSIGIHGHTCSTDARDLARAIGKFAHLCCKIDNMHKKLGTAINASNIASKDVLPSDDTKVEISEAWAKAMRDTLTQKMPDLVSDYIIDLVAAVRDYASKEYSSRELNQIGRFVRSQVGEKVFSDEKFGQVLTEAREEFIKKIILCLQSPDCYNSFKKNLRSFDV